MFDRKVFVIIVVVVLVVGLSWFFIFDGNRRYRAGFGPEQAFEEAREEAKAWSSDASLILAWGMEYGEVRIMYPASPCIELDRPPEESFLAGDSNLGDGRANLWVFIFYSDYKSSLYEVRGRLTVGAGWDTSTEEVPTSFDYSSYEIELKNLECEGENFSSYSHLLWKYGDYYDWVTYESSGFKEEVGGDYLGSVSFENTIPENSDLVYDFFWEPIMPFIDVFRGSGFVVLPDYGGRSDLRASTFLVRSRNLGGDSLTLFYPGGALNCEPGEYDLSYWSLSRSCQHDGFPPIDNAIDNTSFDFNGMRGALENSVSHYSAAPRCLYPQGENVSLVAWDPYLGLDPYTGGILENPME